MGNPTFFLMKQQGYWRTPIVMILSMVFFAGCTDNASTPGSADKGINRPANGAAMQHAKALSAIDSSKALLMDGDLLTRSDDDFESRTLQNFSKRDQSFSHSGIVFKEDSGWMVYHSMTGVENPGGNCRKDPYDSFVNPSMKTGFGLFRYALTDIERKAFHQVLQRNHAAAIPFDISFDLSTNDSMYCSEMIYKALKEATKNRVILPVSVLNNYRPKILGYTPKKAFYKKLEYIGIDDLYLNPFCKEILRVKY